MKLAVRLLLALFGVWLALLPASALAAGPRAAEPRHEVAGATKAVASSVESLPAPPIAVRVAPSPFFARLPATPSVSARVRATWPRLAACSPSDARRAIGRVQVRRAVPRLNDAEPPWFAVG